MLCPSVENFMILLILHLFKSISYFEKESSLVSLMMTVCIFFQLHPCCLLNHLQDTSLEPIPPNRISTYRCINNKLHNLLLRFMMHNQVRTLLSFEHTPTHDDALCSTDTSIMETCRVRNVSNTRVEHTCHVYF